MDVAGAKVLQRRLDPARVVQAARSAVDVPEDALPVFHWFGVAQVPSAAPDEASVDRRSWLRRFGLNAR